MMSKSSKYYLDCRKERVYSESEIRRLLLSHVAAHRDVKPSECAGCKELQEKFSRQERENHAAVALDLAVNRVKTTMGML